MIPAAQRDHGVGDGAEIGPAVEHDRIESVARRDHRGQFPIGEVGGEDHRRLAVVLHPQEPLDVVGAVVDEVAVVAIAGADVIEMGDLGADTAEIVPHAAQDFLDLGVGLFRKGSAQIGAADAMLRQPRPDGAHDRAADIADPDPVAAMRQREKHRRHTAGGDIGERLCRVAHRRAKAFPVLAHAAGFYAGFTD